MTDAPDRTRHRLLLVHQFDPRGDKIGGVETHVRMLLRNFPGDCDVVLAGIDEHGDLPIGRPCALPLADGRSITFVPVVRNTAANVSLASRSLLRSTTARFALGLVRHVPLLRRLASAMPASLELERSEYAFLPRLLGVPAISIVHSDYARQRHVDSLTARYVAVNDLAEALMVRESARIVLVNSEMRDRYAASYPRSAAKLDVMSVPVDTTIFRPSPLDLSDGIVRIVYTGRLEAVKDPALMFATIDRLARRIAQKVEFHYIGTSDPTTFAEFASIQRLTVRHGFQHAEGVARILARCHMGILTSHAEGMPCSVLEVLASGRTMGAIRLPQLERVIRQGRTGVLVDRQADLADSADAMSAALAGQWQEICAGKYEPAQVAAGVVPYSAAVVLPRLFDLHRGLASIATPEIAA